MGAVAKVIIQRPLPEPFSYSIPDILKQSIKIGSHVRVPFRSTVIDGFVVDIEEDSGLESTLSYKLKDILEVPFSEPVFTDKDLAFFRWISDYYQLPLGEIFHSAFPKSIFKVLKRTSKSVNNFANSESSEKVNLTADQQLAYERIYEFIASQKFKSFLLFGVTGSGKTEVYIRSALKALEQKRSALILVPEIALTPQLSQRFEETFGDNVAILHSGLTEKSRREYWWDILRGRRKIVVGARSALFAPLQNIGLIVVDEEHEPSYKQEDRLRYSARDLALVRAKQHQAVCILGSATPAIETFYASLEGKHELLRLRNRPKDRPMPIVEIIDLKDEKPLEENENLNEPTLFSQKLLDQLSETIIRGEQAIIFVNRKGFASFYLCQECGHVPKCLNCSVSLTFYKKSNTLSCHYCGLKLAAAKECSRCHSADIKLMGVGTELVEEKLKELFPRVKIERLDTEVATTTKLLKEKLASFRKKEIQVLVGTQMVAKGHDFPDVTFIGIILADLSLNIPDFRAAERTFQLVSQVSGRAGRGDKAGKVVLQTYLPEHYSIQSAAAQDYEAFYKAEIEYRKEFGYPPFSKLAQIEFRHLKENSAKMDAKKVKSVLDQLQSGVEANSFSYLGPSAAAISRISNQYRWQILLRSEKTSTLNSIIKTLRKEGVRFIDVDPVTTL